MSGARYFSFFPLLDNFRYRILLIVLTISVLLGNVVNSLMFGRFELWFWSVILSLFLSSSFSDPVAKNGYLFQPKRWSIITKVKVAKLQEINEIKHFSSFETLVKTNESQVIVPMGKSQSKRLAEFLQVPYLPKSN